MKKASDILKEGKALLKEAGIESFSFDAAVLFEHICGMSRTDVILNSDRLLCGDGYISACKSRADGQPLQYIIGKWEFMGLEFCVNKNVLIPRADTETSVNYVLEQKGSTRVLDMCTGSGCIGISIAHYLKGARVTLADISTDALAVATQNAKLNGVDVEIIQADLTEGYENYFKKEEDDIIVSNPPYIKSNSGKANQNDWCADQRRRRSGYECCSSRRCPCRPAQGLPYDRHSARLQWPAGRRVL